MPNIDVNQAIQILSLIRQATARKPKPAQTVDPQAEIARLTAEVARLQAEVNRLQAMYDDALSTAPAIDPATLDAMIKQLQSGK